MRKVASLGRRLALALLVAGLWASQGAAAPALEVDEAARLAQAREAERRTGYFEVGWFMSAAGWLPDFGSLNDTLEDHGFARLDKPALLSAGGGYFSVDGWRIGGMGGQGAADAQKGANFAQLEASFGGGHFARALRLGRHTSLDVGALFGGGRATLILSQGSPSTIEEAVQNRYDTVLATDFAVVGPVVGLQYNLWGWLAFRLEVGHLFTLGSWTHSTRGSKVIGGPSLTGPYVSFTVGVAVEGPIPFESKFQWDDEDGAVTLVY